MSNLKVIFKMFWDWEHTEKNYTGMQILLGNYKFFILFYTFTIELN